MNIKEVLRNSSEFNIVPGEKVRAGKLYSWTLYEFEDCPLIVEEGDEGVVSEVSENGNFVVVVWNKDEFPHIKKRLSKEEALTLKTSRETIKNGE